MPLEETTYRESVDQRMRAFEKNTSETLGEILEQTKRTNGRVSKLEKWQSYLMGAVAMLGLVLSIAVALGAAIIK